jgi:hypothetical protein
MRNYGMSYMSISAVRNVSNNDLLPQNSFGETRNPAQLSTAQKIGKLFLKTLVRGVLFSAAVGVGAIATYFGVNVILSCAISGFAFATAMGTHNKIMSLIDAWFTRYNQPKTN